METSKIAGLTSVPSANEPDAIKRLTQLLEQHRYRNPVDNRGTVAPADNDFFKIDRNEKIIACLLMIRADGEAVLYGFADKGPAAIFTLDATKNSYTAVARFNSWQQGYKQMIRDIRDFWRQREIDAGVLAEPYKLLLSRLT